MIHFATDVFVQELTSGFLRLRYTRINEPSATVHNTMTLRTERDQIFAGVISQATPRPNMVNLQIIRPATVLTAPAVPTKNLVVKFRVGHRIQALTRTPGAQIVHRAVPSCSINLGLSSAGNN